MPVIQLATEYYKLILGNQANVCSVRKSQPAV